MTPPTFRIGDLVEITGPSAVGARICVGDKFVISEILKRTDDELYSDADHTWYPAGSLRLVEELKIGDWAEVIGPALGGSENERGQIFKITQDETMCAGLSAIGMAAYRPTSLRKLTPDEVLCHLTKRSGFTIEQRLNSLEEYAKENDARVSAIEKRQDEAREYSDDLEKITETLANRIYDLQKRVDFIEAFQKDQHPTYMTYTYKPDEPGTIIINCACGRKHEIEATPRAFQKDEAPEVCDDCTPPEGQISISIRMGKNEVHGISNSRCPMECVEWCQEVLDGMRKEDRI